jgi:hypothetical protein
MSSKGEKNTCSKVLLANITSSFSTREFQFMSDEEGNGFKFQSFTNCCYHGVFVTHTHTHTHHFFLGVILCDFAPFLQNLGFFFFVTKSIIFWEKKGQNPPPKKSSSIYTRSKLVAKNIYMDVQFFPS